MASVSIYLYHIRGIHVAVAFSFKNLYHFPLQLESGISTVMYEDDKSAMKDTEDEWPLLHKNQQLTIGDIG